MQVPFIPLFYRSAIKRMDSSENRTVRCVIGLRRGEDIGLRAGMGQVLFLLDSGNDLAVGKTKATICTDSTNDFPFVNKTLRNCTRHSLLPVHVSVIVSCSKWSGSASLNNPSVSLTLTDYPSAIKNTKNTFLYLYIL